MNRTRAQICLALDALIEEKNGIAFQRLACQCLHPRWPSLMATAEQADLGEDALTIIDEGSDGVIRSLACSLTAKWSKISKDAQTIAAMRSDVQEIIFATPKAVTRKEQKDWEKRIKDELGWKLVVVERSEFLNVLERPESQWIREQHLNIPKKDEDPGILNDAAGQLWDKGANAEARAVYSKAYTAALSCGNDRAACHALAGLGWCALIEKDFASAYAHATTCRDLATRVNSFHYRASALIICARVALIQRNLEEAQSFAIAAIEDGKNAASVVQHDAILLLVEVALAKGDLKEALRQLDSVSRKEVKFGGRRAISVFDLRASIHLANGKLRLAATTFEKAAKEAKVLGNLVLHASYLAKAQRALADAGAHRAVLNRSELCEKAALAIENTPLLLETLFSKSWAYKQLGKYDDAKRTLERISSIAESKQCHDLAARAFVVHGQMLRSEGKFDESRSAAEKGLSFAKKSGRDILIGFALIEMTEQESAVGNFEAAQSRFDDALAHFSDLVLHADYRFEIGQAQLRILDGLGRYGECSDLLDRLVDVAREAENYLPRAVEWARAKKKEIETKAEAFDAVSRILKVTGREAKKWAGTENTESLCEANQWVIGTLLDWWDGTRDMFAPPMDVLNLWGEANYGRVILNHRAYYNDAFHLCVNVSSVEQARTACRMLAPICDCLTLVWSGEVLPGFPIPGFSRHLAYDQPTPGWKPRPEGFWEEMNRGYPMCMPPYPRCLMPEDIVLFYLDEARDLTARGKLFLVPGPGVGCVGQVHALSAQMFYQAACAKAVLKVDKDLNISTDLDMLIPWFPNIPISDLAHLCDDHEDNFVEFRRKCMEWGDAVRERGASKLSRIHAEIQSLSKDLDRVYHRIQGSANPDGQMAVGSLAGMAGQEDARQLPRENVQTDVINRLRSLVGQEIEENPWFPYWSFRKTGADWQLGSAITSGGISTDSLTSIQSLLNGNAFHWLRAPGEHKMYVMLMKKDPNQDGEDIVIKEGRVI
jgi:tetratricopeptide (TPR) repeat protein